MASKNTNSSTRNDQFYRLNKKIKISDEILYPLIDVSVDRCLLREKE